MTARNVLFGHDITGPTSARPTNADPGIHFFDETLNQLLVWNGTVWLPVGGMLQFQYDPGGHVKAVADSGAVGTVDTGETLPPKAIILDGMLDIVNAFAGATATLAIQAEAAGDLLGATAVTSLTAGRHDIIPVGTAASSVKTSVARNVKLVIGTAPFTDGTLNGWLRYVVSN